jgi:putative FmdB family regulatory protein
VPERQEDVVPTYQYACTECGHGFEAVQSFSDDALTDCPQCTGRLRKVFNSVGIVFKGSGFYRTDSREKPASTSESSGGTGDTEKAGGTDTKTSGESTKSSPNGSSPSSSGSSTAKSGSSSSSGSSSASGSAA